MQIKLFFSSLLMKRTSLKKSRTPSKRLAPITDYDLKSVPNSQINGRKANRFKEPERLILKDAFKQDTRPSKSTQTQLAERIGVSYVKVNAWFRKERMRTKKTLGEAVSRPIDPAMTPNNDIELTAPECISSNKSAHKLTFFGAKNQPNAVKEKEEEIINPKFIKFEDLIDLSHLERLEYFVESPHLDEITKSSIITKEMARFRANNMQIPFSNYDNFLLAKNLPTIIIPRNIILKFDESMQLIKRHDYHLAAKSLNECMNLVESDSLKFNPEQLSDLKFVISYFLEATLIAFMDNLAFNKKLVNLNSFLFRNEYTEEDIEIEDDLLQANLIKKVSPQKQKGDQSEQINLSEEEQKYALSICNVNRSAAFGVTLFNSEYDVEKKRSNPVSLHTVINARLISTLSQSQRDSYVNGVIHAVADPVFKNALTM